MNDKGTLDRLDRATLRTWRVMNVVGWWFVGAAIFNVLTFVLSRSIVQKSADLSLDGLAVALSLATIVFSAGTAGAVVGSRVFRWPGIVGACTVLVPWAAVAVAIVASHLLVEMVVVPFVVFIAAGTAGEVARRVAARRPRALRAEPRATA